MKYLLPRIQDIFFIAIFGVILLFGNRMINLDGDLPRHLLTGKVITENLKVPTTELFIYPYENRQNVSHEWAAQVIFYNIYTFFGLPGLVLLAAALLSTTFTIAYSYLVNRLSMRLPVFVVVAWGAFATSLNWAIRPHLFSMCLLAIWLTWVDRLKQGEKLSLWRFPVFMFIWGNIHGEFIAGMLVLIAFAVGWIVDYLSDPNTTDIQIGKKLWLALGSSFIASLLHPGGANSWLSIFGFVSNPFLMDRMMEANSPDFQMPEMRILLLLLAFSIFLLAVKKKKLSAGQGFLLAGFTAMSLMMFRNIHLYGVVAPFVLADAFTELRDFKFIDKLEGRLSNMEKQIPNNLWTFLASIAMILIILSSPVSSALYIFEKETFPTDAVAWLKKNPQEGHMFNDLNWGGYLELNLWPQQKAFVDSNADGTGEVSKEYETVLTTSSGWESIIEKYDIQWAVIPVKSRLAAVLTENGWKILYQDKTAVVLHAP